MAYRVDLTERADRNLRLIYLTINAEDGARALAGFNGLEQAVLSLGEHPARGAPIPEDGHLRHLLHGRRRHRHRISYAIDEGRRVLTVIHIRHGSRAQFNPDDDE